MSKFSFRLPRRYDGTQVTSRLMSDLLPGVLEKVGELHRRQSALILALWPEIIGVRLAGMTQALSFVDGTLIVKVSNSTLYSLLSQYERPRLLRLLRQKFPHAEIKNLYFRMG